MMTYQRYEEFKNRIGLFYEYAFNGEWEKFQVLIDQGLWNDVLLKGLSDEEYTDIVNKKKDDFYVSPFVPLHHIPIALDILFHWDDWNDKTIPIIQQRAEKNDKFIKFFKEQFNVPMDYNELMWFDTYSYYAPEDPFEDVFCTTRQEMHEYGLRDIDIDLYWAVYTLNFKWADELLQKGGDPYVVVDDGESVFSVIDWMLSGPEIETDKYLIDPKISYRFYVDKSYGFFSYLIRYALFAKMQSLVEKYHKKPAQK